MTTTTIRDGVILLLVLVKKSAAKTHIYYSIYILNKVCRKYAEGMQCISLTLSAYLVLQQLSLFQTARASFTKCIKTLNSFVKTFFSPDVFFWFGLLRLLVVCLFDK